MTEETQVTNEEVATSEAPAEQPGLTFNDLVNIKKIIDTASSRGAFQPNEMTTVGVTYDRLLAFLKSIAPEPTEEEATEGDAEAEPTSEG